MLPRLKDGLHSDLFEGAHYFARDSQTPTILKKTSAIVGAGGRPLQLTVKLKPVIVLVVEDTDMPSKPDPGHPFVTSPFPVLSPARQTNPLEEVFLPYNSLGF